MCKYPHSTSCIILSVISFSSPYQWRESSNNTVNIHVLSQDHSHVPVVRWPRREGMSAFSLLPMNLVKMKNFEI